MAISVASCKNWKIHSLDVKAAYLQGDEISRDVFLIPPREYYEGKLWKLKKTVYGLCDAGRAWYMRVKNELTVLGMSQCSLDPSIFVWHEDGLAGILCIYVDDFLWAGTEKFKSCVIDRVCQLFRIGTSNSDSFKYVD